MEGDYRPPQEPTDTLSSPDTIHTLMEGKSLRFETPKQAYDMLLDLSAEAGMHDDMPEDVVMKIHNISLAFGFLMYDQLFDDTSKGSFLETLYDQRKDFQTDQLELTQDEAEILQRIARAVNIDYDPGSDETPERRIFPFSEVEQQPPSPDTLTYQFLLKRKRRDEQNSHIVESDPVSPFIES